MFAISENNIPVPPCKHKWLAAAQSSYFYTLLEPRDGKLYEVPRRVTSSEKFAVTKIIILLSSF